MVGLFDCIDTNAANGFEKRIQRHAGCGYEEIMEAFFREILPESEIFHLFEAACNEFKELCVKMGKMESYKMGMFQKLLFSSLLDADRFDAYCFEAGIVPRSEMVPCWSRAVENMERRMDAFTADTPINKARCDISKQCLKAANRKNGIYRLSVPTGSGKTLASLRFALNFAEKNKKQHIFYVIPYTTILDQTADEVSKICGENMVLEHHSGVVIENEDDDKKYDLLTQRWNVPIILTTLVQFMNAIYAGKSACARRLHSLCNSVIIIDEVQTLPKRTIHLFNEAMNFLCEFCKTTILLCSATQPEFALSEKHPLKLAERADIVEKSKEISDVFRRVSVMNQYSEKGTNLEKIADFSQRTPERSVLVIMNKVSQAREIYDKIECSCRKIYLSTKKCAEHRKKEIELIKKYTKDIANNSDIDTDKLIVVSTQLVEAGVDFSFECVIRAVAGIDSIAQAAGRCNRSGEFSHQCSVYIVNVAGEKLDKLKEIAAAKRYTEAVISENKDIDLLSDEGGKKVLYQIFSDSQKPV